jgi:hypothetical protein
VTGPEPEAQARLDMLRALRAGDADEVRRLAAGPDHDGHSVIPSYAGGGMRVVGHWCEDCDADATEWAEARQEEWERRNVPSE